MGKDSLEITNIAKRQLENLKILNGTPHGKYVKGGSWNDDPVNLIVHFNNLHSIETPSSSRGFRIALDHIGMPIFYNPELEKMNKKYQRKYERKNKIQ
ncbi:MAG: hypothetical protein O3C22_06960 [Bacteroidetes bacterium]|nr:hypothetical protein [Bacteroidota bacterium]MDA0943971.1 hypothetical protein [Bacteroidota bacterium]